MVSLVAPVNNNNSRDPSGGDQGKQQYTTLATQHHRSSNYLWNLLPRSLFFCFSLLIIPVVWTVKQISLPADSGELKQNGILTSKKKGKKEREKESNIRRSISVIMRRNTVIDTTKCVIIWSWALSPLVYNVCFTILVLCPRCEISQWPPGSQTDAKAREILLPS